MVTVIMGDLSFSWSLQALPARRRVGRGGSLRAEEPPSGSPESAVARCPFRNGDMPAQHIRYRRLVFALRIGKCGAEFLCTPRSHTLSPLPARAGYARSCGRQGAEPAADWGVGEGLVLWRPRFYSTQPAPGISRNRLWPCKINGFRARGVRKTRCRFRCHFGSKSGQYPHLRKSASKRFAFAEDLCGFQTWSRIQRRYVICLDGMDTDQRRQSPRLRAGAKAPS
jgi:hypothetical protein